MSKKGHPALPSKQNNAYLCCLGMALIVLALGKACQAALSEAQLGLLLARRKLGHTLPASDTLPLFHTAPEGGYSTAESSAASAA